MYRACYDVDLVNIPAAAAGWSEGDIATSSHRRVQCYGNLLESDAVTDTPPHCRLGYATD